MFLIIDNARFHKSKKVIDLVEAAGCKVIFLPPYSPDLNPIELIFAKVKQLIRGIRPRTFTQIVQATRQVLAKITLDDIEAVFLHCGYAGT